MYKIKIMVLSAIAFLTIASSVVFVSCNKSNSLITPTITTKTSLKTLPTIKKNRVWQYLVALVIIVVECTEGQATTTTTTTGNTTTTVTTCSGLGHCSAGMITHDPNAGNESLSSHSSIGIVRDYIVNAKLASTQSGDILLLIEDDQNSNEITNRFFYGEYIYFLPNTYTIDNMKVLNI